MDGADEQGCSEYLSGLQYSFDIHISKSNMKACIFHFHPSLSCGDIVKSEFYCPFILEFINLATHPCIQ